MKQAVICDAVRTPFGCHGGAIALGHPLGASGARRVTTAVYQLQLTGGRYALCTLCVGVGQGLVMLIERV
jgi:acetyl-CoA acyltransferase